MKKYYYYCWSPKKEKKKIVFDGEDIMLAFFLGFTICLYMFY